MIISVTGPLVLSGCWKKNKSDVLQIAYRKSDIEKGENTRMIGCVCVCVRACMYVC